MENISIKDHPPWYARGTPLINTRDGPSMALSNKPLFAIGRGPSGKGSGQGKGRGGSQQAAVGSPPGRSGRTGWQSEDRSRGKPKGKNRRWLTLKTTFFNTKNSVYGQWYGVLGRKMDVVVGNHHLLTLSSAGE